jgi:3-phenylpropionate/cinnamic acid dioxygenase small subunit
MTEGSPGGSAGDRFALYDLFATYGALIDAAEFDAWLALFATTCSYHIVPRENHERGLPAGLVYCDSRAMLEDRIHALREANKYNIHTDRHLIGLLASSARRLMQGWPKRPSRPLLKCRGSQDKGP